MSCDRRLVPPAVTPRKETETDVELRVPLPPGTPVKSIELEVTKTSLMLGLRGRDGPVLKASGELVAPDGMFRGRGLGDLE